MVLGFVFSFFATFFTFLMGFLAFFNSLRFLAIASSCPLRLTQFRFIVHFAPQRHRGRYGWAAGRVAYRKTKKFAGRREGNQTTEELTPGN
jgi:hypothetical protein